MKTVAAVSKNISALHIIRILRHAAIGAVVMLVAVNLFVKGDRPAAVIALVCGLLWLAGYLRNFRFIPRLCFTVICGLIAWSALEEFSVVIHVPEVLLAIAAYDLDSFFQRTRDIGRCHIKKRLIRDHMLRLGGVAVVSIILLAFAFGIELKMGFWPALFFSLLLIIGITGVIRLLRQRD